MQQENLKPTDTVPTQGEYGPPGFEFCKALKELLEAGLKGQENPKVMSFIHRAYHEAEILTNEVYPDMQMQWDPAISALGEEPEEGDTPSGSDVVPATEPTVEDKPAEGKSEDKPAEGDKKEEKPGSQTEETGKKPEEEEDPKKKKVPPQMKKGGVVVPKEALDKIAFLTNEIKECSRSVVDKLKKARGDID